MESLKVILFFACMYPVLLFSQLNGRYCCQEMSTVECMEFYPDSCFRYSFQGCTGGSYGEGHYSLHDTSLILIFGDGVNTDFIIGPQITQNSHYSCLYVHVCDMASGVDFPDVKYTLQDSDGTILLQGKADSIGNFKMTVSKTCSERVLVISYGGEKRYYCLKCDADYSIQIKFQIWSHNWQIEAGDQWPYRISVADDSIFFLKPLWYDSWISKFEKGRKSAWETIRLKPQDQIKNNFR